MLPNGEEELDITPLFDECALPADGVRNQVDKKYGKKRPLASHHGIEKHKDLRLKNDMHRKRKGKSHSAHNKIVIRSSSGKSGVKKSAPPINRNLSQEGDWFCDEDNYFVFGK